MFFSQVVTPYPVHLLPKRFTQSPLGSPRILLQESKLHMPFTFSAVTTGFSRTPLSVSSTIPFVLSAPKGLGLCWHVSNTQDHAQALRNALVVVFVGLSQSKPTISAWRLRQALLRDFAIKRRFNASVIAFA